MRATRTSTMDCAAWHAHFCPERQQEAATLDFASLAAACAPHLAPASQDLLTTWVSWFFWYDRVAEGELRHAPATLERLNRCLLDAMRDDARSSTAPAIVAAFAANWQALPPLSALARARLITDLSMYFDATRWEQATRGAAVSLDTYCLQRPYTSGMFAFLDIIEILSGLAPADDAVSVSRTLTARLASWANDIASWPKEAAAGDTHNLVLILARDAGVAPRDALAAAVDFVAADERAWVSWCADINPAHRTLYLQVLEGNARWTHESVRYAATRAVGE